MNSDEVEEAVLDHEALGDSALVSDHLANAFGDVCTLDFGHIALVFLLDEYHEPHLPHADERFIYISEAMLLHVLL